MASCAIIALAPGRRKRRVSNWVTRTAWSKWPSWESMNWRPIKPQATRTQVARARPFAPESSLTRAGRERLIGRPSFGRIRVAPWMRAACSLQLKGARLSPAATWPRCQLGGSLRRLWRNEAASEAAIGRAEEEAARPATQGGALCSWPLRPIRPNAQPREPQGRRRVAVGAAKRPLWPDIESLRAPDSI